MQDNDTAVYNGAGFGSTELAVRADRDGTTADALLAEWLQHKLEQHSDDDA